MRKLLLLTSLFMLPPTLMAASNDQYADDLAGLYGDVQQVRAMEELCSQQFPATASSNRRAVSNWRQQYSPFVAEIESRWERWLVVRANGISRQHETLVAWSKELYESSKSALSARLLTDGLELFQKRCENYPIYLKSPRKNPELVHAETLRRIRQLSQ
ncbi:MAG: hypothetical protein PHQ58_23460 [Rhodoferax sp.]|uniref:hypothetical protein n=1 Tax=Rhodoferax sp. TaxID=50421 RepID=UPI00261D162D|nr:hypothetical protein [Rhodoferax sp.]MDD2883379.1 hypothetical protein [Rhodoferax sp.]